MYFKVTIEFDVAAIDLKKLFKTILSSFRGKNDFIKHKNAR
jgi:hypothetical protein